MSSRKAVSEHGAIDVVQKVGLLGRTWRYLRDPSVPFWRKLVGVAAVGYVVWPLDLVPDVVPILGWLDDLGILTVAAWFVLREIRKHTERMEAQRVQVTPPDPKA